MSNLGLKFMRSGLCLGGPLDGEYRSCEHKHLEAVETIDPEANFLRWRMYEDGDVLLATASVRKVAYAYQDFKTPAKTFGFWVLIDYTKMHEPGPVDVMDFLIKNYRPVKKKWGRDAVAVDGEYCVLIKERTK